jgi:RiboL-PSP-HEPN
MNGRREVARLRQRLNATFSRAPSSSEDIELQSDFARYLAVLTCGFLETAIVALVLNFVQRKSSAEVTSFVEKELEYWTNPHADKIIKLLGAFSREWRQKGELFFVDEQRDSINSLLALRHKIAHGESVGTSLSQVRGYYAAVGKAIDFLADVFEPTV